MRRVRFFWVAGVSVLAAALAWVDSRAAVDDATNAAINKVADLIDKGDKDGAEKAAKQVAKDAAGDVETVMSSFKLRSKKGIGVGTKPGVSVPDGIELKINAIVRDGITTGALKKEGEALVRAGHVAAAIGQIAHNMPPEMETPKKKKADWLEWSAGMVKAADEFSAAAKANDAQGLKKAANKLKQSCDTCHMVFKIS